MGLSTGKTGEIGSGDKAIRTIILAQSCSCQTSSSMRFLMRVYIFPHTKLKEDSWNILSPRSLSLYLAMMVGDEVGASER